MPAHSNFPAHAECMIRRELEQLCSDVAKLAKADACFGRIAVGLLRVGEGAGRATTEIPSTHLRSWYRVKAPRNVIPNAGSRAIEESLMLR